MGCLADTDLSSGSINVVPKFSTEKLSSRSSCSFSAIKYKLKHIARGHDSIPTETHDLNFSLLFFSLLCIKQKHPQACFLTGAPGGPGGPAMPGGPGGPCKRGSKISLSSNSLLVAESPKSFPTQSKQQKHSFLFH